jgi:hypothetical protein
MTCLHCGQVTVGVETSTEEMLAPQLGHVNGFDFAMLIFLLFVINGIYG